jgi:hypothetical protein
MILLAHRNSGTTGLLTQIAATGADLLVGRINERTMPVLARNRTAPICPPSAGRTAWRAIDQTNA